MVSMKELELEIAGARKALQEVMQLEIDEDYDDALLSMDREHAQGWLDGLEYAYVLMNGHEYNAS